MTHRRIQEVLSGIEAEQGVRILYACESGSRGWGFDSADSDWDVRFIYCHPRDWYLSIEEDAAAMAAYRSLAQDFYQPAACLHHYLRMAKGNFREYLQGETVGLKKYFYVLRPVLACMWIERGLGVMPMAFGELVAGVVHDDELRDCIAS